MNKKLVSALLLPGLALGTSVVSATSASALSQSDINQLSEQIAQMQTGATKTALQARLETLKTTLATEAVTAAGTSPSVATLTDAKTKVAALAVGASRTALQTTLDGHLAAFAVAEAAKATTSGTRADRIAAQTAIDLIVVAADKVVPQAAVTIAETAAATAAATAIATARGADTQSSLDAAATAVGKVVDNAALLVQLQVQQAQVALAKAVTSGKLVDLNAAQVLVDALPFDAFTAPLEDRADVVSAYSAEITARQVAATTAVVTAEGAKTQANHDAAIALVNELPAAIAGVKGALATRLAAVQTAIDGAISDAVTAATAKVVIAEGSNLSADVTTAAALVNALGAGSAKTALTARLDYVSSVITATAKVVTAETTKTQANHDAANTDVNKLNAGTVKSDLATRLAVVQADVKLIEATALVTAAVSSDTKADWDKAFEAVSALADSAGKTTQAGLLSAQLPETLVAEAEASDKQADLDVAVTAVSGMAAGAAKTALNVRVVAQQSLLITNATTAVALAETSSNYKDRDAALVLVNALPASATKTQLVTRLADIATAVENVRPEKALANAEASDTQADLNYAKSQIDALAGSGRKDGLVTAAAAQQLVVNGLATSAVTAATTQAQVTAALALVDALIEGAVKTAQLTALATKQKALDDAAIALVVAAEADDLQASLTSAKTATDLLKAGDVKTSLLARITAQQVIVDLTAEIKTIETAVSSSATKQAEIDAVLLKVEALADSTAKTLLLREIAGVQKVSDLLNASEGSKRDAANAAVSAAEASFSAADVTAATTAIAALPDGQLKTRLTPRLAAVSSVVSSVETAVAAVEANKTQANLDAAVAAVSGMVASTGKTAFAARNSAVKAIIDAASESAAASAAVASVDAAVAADTSASLAAAQALVSALPTGDLKVKLQAILDVQAGVVAEKSASDAALAAKLTAEAEKAAALAAKLTAEAEKAAALAAKLAAEDAKATAESKASALQAIIDAQQAAEASKGSTLVGIGFSTGSSKLSASALKKLVAEAKAVKVEHNLVSITVQGVGANRDLALNRAVAIISALKKAGFNVRVTLSTSTKASSTARVTFNWQD